MKKIIFSLALLLGWATAAQAQTGVQVGVKAGLSIAVLDGTINQGAEPKTGFHVGGVLRFRPSAHVAIQPELVFSQQGSDNRTPIGPVVLESQTKLSYLNLPVLVKIYLGKVINLQFGPQFGLLIAAREKGQVGYNSTSSGNSFVTADNDVKADYKGDVGVCAGLGVDLQNGLLLAARANYGFTNINNNEVEQQIRDRFDFGGLHNRVLEFSVGYVFGSN